MVPLAAGTGMDSIVRIYAEDLAKALGKPVVVENQPGAALMLADEGRLSLDEPPQTYLPELPPLAVTIDQMMRNSSGLPDFLELLRLGGHGLDKPARPEDLFAACARNGHLNFAPGSRFLYSNTNFLLLGRIIEKLEGKKLGEVLA